MELVSVAAIDETRAIGIEGELPWPSIPADKRQYRERIADDPVILGRVTYESMRDDLPGRAQIVLSREERDFEAPSAHHAGGVDDAVAIAEALGAETAYVIGGAGIYRLFQPHLDRMVLSRVAGSHEADAFYPEWGPDEWRRVSATEYDRFSLEEWVRVDDGD